MWVNFILLYHSCHFNHLQQKHVVPISFTLESHLMGMKLAIFDKLICNCIPGPNSDLCKAKLLQMFMIPDEIIEDSNSPSNHTVNIFAAWISKDCVWVLVDFAHLVQLHVIKIWTTANLNPTSSVSKKYLVFSMHLTNILFSQFWLQLWTVFAFGPDWTQE